MIDVSEAVSNSWVFEFQQDQWLKHTFVLDALAIFRRVRLKARANKPFNRPFNCLAEFAQPVAANIPRIQNPRNKSAGPVYAAIRVDKFTAECGGRRGEDVHDVRGVCIDYAYNPRSNVTVAIDVHDYVTNFKLDTVGVLQVLE